METGKPRAGELAALAAYALAPEALEGLRTALYARGELLCTEDGPLPALLFVLAGRTRISRTAANGRSLLLGFDEGGGLVGDLELFSGRETASTCVQAATAVRCLSLPLARNRARLVGNAAFLARAGRSLAARLERNTQSAAGLALDPLAARLGPYIAACAGEGRFAENLTETAELLGVSYRHLHRELRRLCDEGALARERPGVYRVLRPAALLHT